jgi:hypothetical protein
MVTFPGGHETHWLAKFIEDMKAMFIPSEWHT